MNLVVVSIVWSGCREVWSRRSPRAWMLVGEAGWHARGQVGNTVASERLALLLKTIRFNNFASPYDFFIMDYYQIIFQNVKINNNNNELLNY